MQAVQVGGGALGSINPDGGVLENSISAIGAGASAAQMTDGISRALGHGPVLSESSASAAKLANGLALSAAVLAAMLPVIGEQVAHHQQQSRATPLQVADAWERNYRPRIEAYVASISNTCP